MDNAITRDIPLLTAQDIECRVQSIKKNQNSGKVGVLLLLYKNARVDMRILDMVYGSGNWQRTHEVINGNLFCNIDIWDADKRSWVRKQDVGVESNTEREKGQASDAFKRAGTNVGIGRELYTSPLIYVELSDKEYYSDDKSGNSHKEVLRCYPSTVFEVCDVSYNERREISELVIKDRYGNIRFDMHNRTSSPAKAFNEPQQTTMFPQTTASIAATRPNPTSATSSMLSCQACGSQITQAEHDYSTSKYRRALCRACQKKR